MIRHFGPGGFPSLLAAAILRGSSDYGGSRCGRRADRGETLGSRASLGNAMGRGREGQYGGETKLMRWLALVAHTHFCRRQPLMMNRLTKRWAAFFF